MASADNCLDILVWNLHCNVCRKEEIEAELQDNAGEAKKRYKDLILLCTDKVFDYKRVILNKRFSPTGAKETDEAAIYYQPTGSYSMSYVDIDGFCKKHLVDVPRYTEGRFTASVLHKASKTILVVAWHGWKNRPKEVLEKHAKIKSVSEEELIKTFKRTTLVELLEFVENIRKTSHYGAVIVGGDFNLYSTVAAEVMENEMQNLQGNVLDCCHESKIDYLLFWNKGSQEITWKSPSRVFKKERTVFNHPVLHYKFSLGT